MMEKWNIGMMEYWEEMILIPLISTHYSIVPTQSIIPSLE